MAEELNFTRAAERLHISQQALSTSIRTFERELGTSLFERNRRQVVLTRAGELLVQGGPWLLAVATSLRERVRTADDVGGPVLRVGHTPAVTSEEVFACLRHTREANPKSSIVVTQYFPQPLVDGLFDGAVDVALSRAGVGLGVPDQLSTVRLRDQRLRIAVASEHSLAAHQSVNLAELSGETFVLWAEPGSSAYSDLLLAECHRVGFAPRYTVNPVQGTPPVTAVAGTPYLAFVTAPRGPALSGAVTVIDAEPEIRAPITATWISGTTHPLRDALVAEGQRVV